MTEAPFEVKIRLWHNLGVRSTAPQNRWVWANEPVQKLPAHYPEHGTTPVRSSRSLSFSSFCFSSRCVCVAPVYLCVCDPASVGARAPAAGRRRFFPGLDSTTVTMTDQVTMTTEVPAAHQQRTVSVIVSPSKSTTSPCPPVEGLQLFSSLQILNRSYEEQIRYVYSNIRTQYSSYPCGAADACHRLQSSSSPNNSSSTTTTATNNNAAAATAAAITPPGQNRMSYPREFKLLAVKYYYENGRNKYRTCKVFQITKSMLNGWLEKLDKIQQSRPGSLKSGRSGRKPQFPDVEKELFDIYRIQLQQGRKVGNRWLRETAKLIAQRKCKPDELNGMCQFSERWLCNFKKRYGINLTKDWSYNLNNGPTAGKHQKSSDLPDSSQTNENPTATPLCAAERSRQSSVTETCNDDDRLPCKRAHTGSVKGAISDETITCSNQICTALVPKELRTVAVVNGTKAGTTEHSKRGRKVQFPEVEAMLHKRLFEQRSKGVRITNRWLQDEARRLAIELCPKTFNDAFKSARCMFSEHWLHNFKKRYGISLKQNLHAPQPPPPPPPPPLPATAATKTSTSTVDNTDCVSESEMRPKTIVYEDLVDLSWSKNRTTQERMDDLPTMVPIRPFARRATDFSILEWYNRISSTVSQSIDESPHGLTKPIAV